MERVFEQAAALLEAGEEFVLAAIAGSSGSTPRGDGAKMLVRGDGSIIATIGGGALEGRAIARAKQMKTPGAVELLEFDLSQKDANNPEAVCGGEGSVLLYRVTARDLPVFRAMAQAIEARRAASFVALEGEQGGVFCVEEGGNIVSTVPLDARLRKTLTDATVGANMHTESGGAALYAERLTFDGMVYLFGGGHVALATAEVCHTAGFQVTVFEEREQFITPERFPHAKRELLSSFHELPALPLREDDYIIIVTRGHSFDRVCLEWALKTPAGYIGMIGSKTKRDLLYDKMESEGYSRAALGAVHCPIGLSLGGGTPGEIGVAIVAQLIQERAGRAK